MKTTYKVYVSRDYYVDIVYCAMCGTYLGVEYPSDFCDPCWMKGLEE